MSLSSCRLMAKRNSLLGLALHRSFSRSTIGLRFPQVTLRLDILPEQKQRVNNNASNESEKSWVNITCVAIAALGLGFSLFSTRQLCDDPKRRILWKK